MANNLTIISEKLQSNATLGRLMITLGHDDQARPEAVNDAKRYALSVLAEVEKTAGDSKKDLTVCNPNSIVQAMVDAASFRLPIDGRQLAHLVKFGNSATFMPGYRGYLYKVKETYPDADITVRPIYAGEVVKIHEENGDQTYTVTGEVDPFDVDDKDLKGVLVAVTYTDGGRLIRKAQAVRKIRIDRARKAAKQDFVWASDYIEKAKAAAIKAAFKIQFASLQGLQDLIRYDNQKFYDIEKPVDTVEPGSIIGNLNKALRPEAEKAVQEAEEEKVIPDAEIDDTPSGEPETGGGDVSRETDGQDLKTMAAQISAEIREAKTEQDVFDIFDRNFKADLELIQEASDNAYQTLREKADARIKQLRGA